jgi:NTE family protein
LNRWKKDTAARLKSPGVQPEYYLISVDFDQLHGKADDSFFDSLPTNLHLSAGTVDRVVAAGERLLKDSSEFQRLLSDLRNSP